MIQSRHCSGFALDAFRKMLVGNFDGNDAVQSGIPGFIDLSHASCADWRKDFVGSQTSPSSKGHGCVHNSTSPSALMSDHKIPPDNEDQSD
jgi:hypothetical protein